MLLGVIAVTKPVQPAALGNEIMLLNKHLVWNLKGRDVIAISL